MRIGVTEKQLYLVVFIGFSSNRRPSLASVRYICQSQTSVNSPNWLNVLVIDAFSPANLK